MKLEELLDVIDGGLKLFVHDDERLVDVMAGCGGKPWTVDDCRGSGCCGWKVVYVMPGTFMGEIVVSVFVEKEEA